MGPLQPSLFGSPKTYSQRIQPLLSRLSTSTIARYIGVLRGYAGSIRKGYRPHPRHREVLGKLVRSGYYTLSRTIRLGLQGSRFIGPKATFSFDKTQGTKMTNKAVLLVLLSTVALAQTLQQQLDSGQRFIATQPGTILLSAPLVITASGQTIDFSATTLVCNFDDDCIRIGYPSSYNRTANVTVINAQGAPTVIGGTHSFIVVYGQKTRIINIRSANTKQGAHVRPSGDGSRGSGVSTRRTGHWRRRIQRPLRCKVLRIVGIRSRPFLGMCSLVHAWYAR